MRSYALALILAAAFAFPLSAFSQEFEIGPNGLRVEPLQHEHHRDHAEGRCRELRAACAHKHELGEEGQGNCELYRRECGD